MNETIVIGNKIWTVSADVLMLGDEKRVIMKLAEKHHWSDPQVVGTGGMIDEPVVKDNWRYEPLNLNESIIPKLALKRIKLILNSGVQPAGYIIGHDTEIETKPKPLPWVLPPTRPDFQPLPWVVAPEPDPYRQPEIKPWNEPEKEIDWGRIGSFVWGVVKVIGMIALVVLAVLGAIVGGFTGCITDPSIIIVLQESGEWIEVYRDYSSPSS